MMFISEVAAPLTDFYTTFKRPINIVLIIVIALFANWLLRFTLRRTVQRIVQGVKKAQDVDSTSELTAAPYINARAVQRTRTLGTVGRHVITWSIVVFALIAILANMGVNLAALLTSAGIVAAGLTFGAQNIVKDILNGLFMAFEDQLGVGDSVTIGAVTGTVEDVGIRVTQVRAYDGTLWFIRNGEILMLGNASQGWGRAVIDITVEADQDLKHVGEVAIDAAEDLLAQEQYRRKVTGFPEILGLESVSGNRATLRLTMRTRPEARDEVRRALRAAIRRSFNEQGIKLADELPPALGGQA
ncbi:mechanosensitive ion channel [Leucobacter sp. cx-328]|uniref:mechanosensitive ion channel family protein n=1 Tax=unclassified Leucobacter TaxID=2621730 RepID=UPI00165E0734|nr:MULTISPECIES: mechanosensitive ion channel domain-containing protein [unclassified Leucobacter]MBC9944130.1 mechanosensitive ion channel [Leucobacter sp. cx-328]